MVLKVVSIVEKKIVSGRPHLIWLHIIRHYDVAEETNDVFIFFVLKTCKDLKKFEIDLMLQEQEIWSRFNYNFRTRFVEAIGNISVKLILPLKKKKEIHISEDEISIINGKCMTLTTLY